MKTIIFLSLPNIFMTFTWYVHLKARRDNSAGSRIGQRGAAALAPTHDVRRGEPSGWGDHKPWTIAALTSWGVTLFGHLLQVPANRAGYGQLKIMQEPLRLDFNAHHPWRAAFRAELKFAQFRSLRYCLWAGLCLVSAACLMFRFRTPVSGGA